MLAAVREETLRCAAVHNGVCYEPVVYLDMTVATTSTGDDEGLVLSGLATKPTNSIAESAYVALRRCVDRG